MPLVPKIVKSHEYFRVLSIEERANLNLMQAIMEHRWKDALILLPIAISSTSYKSSRYFLWKCFHIVIMNSDVSKETQFKIIYTFLKPWTAPSEMLIECFSQFFMDMNEETRDLIYMLKKRMSCHGKMASNSKFLLNGYYALLFYYHWKQKQFRSSKVETLETVDLGIKAYKLFDKIFNNRKSSSKTLKELSEDLAFGYPIEWVFAPFLELIEYREFASTKKSLGVKANDGFTMISDYLSQNKGSLSSLITAYHFITTYYPKKTSLIIDLLKEISSLSPENCLVLDYVDFLLGNDIKKLFQKSVSSEDDNNSCLLAGQNICVLLKCIKLLCTFLEYEMRWKHVKGWETLVSILQLFHRSWLQCWECVKCQKSKLNLSKQACSLTLWPVLFWNSYALSKFSDSPQIILYSAYASFIFGNKVETVRECLKLCKNYNYKKQKRTLKSLVQLRGKHSLKFEDYLAANRSRFPTQVPIPQSKYEKSEKKDNLVIHAPITYRMKTVKFLKFKDFKNNSDIPYFGQDGIERKRKRSQPENRNKTPRLV